MATVLVIKEPTPFYSQLDEDHFFAWLNEIPNVAGVKGTKNGLEVMLNDLVVPSRPIRWPSMKEFGV